MGRQRFPQERAGEPVPIGPAGVRGVLRQGRDGDVLRRQFRRCVLRRAAQVG